MTISNTSAPRKPRIMVAGEFSAGKTRLINTLLGSDVLPSQVTSTSLPPVWLVHGTGPGVMVSVNGKTQALDFDRIEVEAIAYCVLPLQAPLLEHCDFIDTPGNSDPNIPASSWERMLGFADGLIWCTSAMQAWRQSEKSAVSDIPSDLRANATLLVTQTDRLQDEAAINKVLARVDRESSGLFAQLAAASLVSPEDMDPLREMVVEVAQSLPLRGADAAVVDGNRYADGPAAKAPQELPQDVIAAPAPKKPSARKPSAGPATALWQTFAKDADLDDIDQLKACLDAFLDRLDGISSKRAPKTPPTRAQAERVQ